MTDSNTDGSGVVGQEGLQSSEHPYNIIDLFIQQALGRIGTVKVVKVMGVVNDGGLSAVGFVDVKVMTNLVDGLLGSSQSQDTAFQLPYCRIQGGNNAIIIDPVVGDIGVALICDRDISSVKNNKVFSNPGSFRRFSLSDGIYLGGILNGVPTQYVQMNSDGVTVADVNGGILQMKSDGLHYNKNIIAPDFIINPGPSQISLSAHIHAANNTPPTPGH